MKRYLVVGLGKLGRAVATTLTEAGADVVAVDQSLLEVERLRDEIASTVQADATDPEAMVAAGAKQADAAVVTIGDDFKAAVLATAVLRELGVGTVIARANNAREEKILRLVGASDVLYIEQEVGRRLAKQLLE
jgi:trk system potassium uptake protein